MDQAGSFGQFDELLRRDGSHLRVDPAKQDLRAADLARLGVAEGLEMQAQVAARLAPAGRATLPGETRTAAVAAQVADAEAPAPSLSGEAVYNSACVACHGSGVGGAPRLGDVAAWSSRIAQGEAVLSDRVINGYTGAAGYMPPKGGRVDLSDAEILAAMNYLLDQSR